MARQPDRQLEDSAATDDRQPNQAHISPGDRKSNQAHISPGESQPNPAHISVAARQLTDQLNEHTSRILGSRRGKFDLTATLTDVLTITYTEFLASISEPECCWLLHITDGSEADRKSHGLAWLELEPPIAHRIVARLLGDDATDHNESRVPTPVERKLMNVFVRAVCDAVDATLLARSGVHIILPAGSRAASEPGVSMSANQSVQVVEMAVSLGGVAGQLRLCLPEQFITQAVAEGSYVSVAQDQPPIANQTSVKIPSPQVPQTSQETVQVSAVSGPAMLPADQLAGMQPGDILMTDTGVDEKVIVRLDGTESFIASLGSRNGRRAVRIERAAE